MRLKFEIKQQHIHRTDNEIPVNKSHDYLDAEFKFLTSEWEGLTKTVLFKIPLPKGKEKSYAMQLDSSNTSVITVPWEVLQGHVFKVSVFAGDLITANEVLVYLEESGYTTNVSSTSNPSPDIFTDVFNKLSEKYDNIEIDGEFLLCYSEGQFVNKVDISEIKVKWSNIEGKPNEFPPSSHNHVATDVTDFDDELDDLIDCMINELNKN